MGRLCRDKNWRLRHSSLSLFPKLAVIMGEAQFSAEFGGQEAGWATDNCALIRTDWVKTIGTVAARFDEPKEWLSKHVVPVLEERKVEKRSRALSPQPNPNPDPALTPTSTLT